MGLSSFASVIVALSTLQGPGTRLTYRIRVIEPAAVAPRILASGAVSGPLDSDMRLTLRTDTVEVEALFQVTPLGDTVSAPRGIDLIPEEPARVVQLVLKGRATTLVVSLTRPDPARSARDRALALDADVVCLKVSPPDAPQPLGTICGRLNNIARQLPLPTGDTLAATFAWPGPR